MFQSALLAAARAREETGIGRGAASVSSAAVQLSKKIFGSLKGRRAMILGAGDVAEIALECLQNEGVKVAIVANRTFERAQSLAERHAATAMHYEECWKSLSEVDVLLCSTASPVPVVTVARVRDSIDARRQSGQMASRAYQLVFRDLYPESLDAALSHRDSAVRLSL
jgi:glutamyl-tRNA reductase